MGSAGVRWVIGSRLSEGSCFGFLSFAAAGIPALAGNSSVSEKTQEKESTAARIDLGVAEITGNFGEKVEAERSRRLLPLSRSKAESVGYRAISISPLPREGASAGTSSCRILSTAQHSSAVVYFRTRY